MDTEERQNWVADLKVGDRVAIKRYAYGAQWYEIATITERNKVKIKTNHGHVVNRYGCCGGGGSSYELVPITPEVTAWIHRARAINQLGRVKWDELTTAAIEQIIAIVAAPESRAEKG